MSALLLLQAGDWPGEVQHLRYERPILIAQAGPNCAVLDAEVLSHSLSSMKDIRVFSGDRELSYGIAVNETAQVESDEATVLNLHQGTSATEFDLAMPGRAYTQLTFGLEGRDFVAEATLTGSDQLPPSHPVPVGTFSLFDMTSRGLSRDTTISLQESNFHFLHVRLRGRGFRIRDVEVPPSRERQTLFTTVAETHDLEGRGSETVARFRVPARVPVEQVAVRLDPSFAGNFSRTVRVTAAANTPGSPDERIMGKISRVRAGRIAVDEEAFPASLGANLQADATVEVAVENEGRPALPVTSIALSMRQRTICMDSPGPVELFYGDPQGSSLLSRYEPSGRWQLAHLGPEGLNRSFRERGRRPSWRFRPSRRVWHGVLVFLLVMGVAVVTGWLRRRAGPRS